MYLAADQLVTPGGPSAPVWAFLTTIAAGVIVIIRQQLSARSELRNAREEVAKARESAEKAQQNTRNVSNGFAGRVDSNFETLITAQQNTTHQLGKLQTAFQKHLEWHLEKEGK
jgi:uncharacterized protein HemX